MKILTFISIFIVFLSSSANAKNTFWMGDPPDQDIRQHQAAEWLNCFIKIQEQVPTLSPAEKKWLETEVDNELAKGVITKRAIAALDSKEYNVRVVRSQIGEIILTLTLLAKNKSIEKNEEMLLWARLSTQFLNHDIWQSISYLVDRKIIDKQICNYESFYFENFVLQSQKIIERVIINHINGTLP